MHVRYKVFESSTVSWENLFNGAATFASEVGPERLIGISHSEGRSQYMGGNGVVTVWYWDADSTQEGAS